MTFPTVPSRIVLSAIAASWLGLLIHNVADLGSDVLVGPETLGPTMVYLLLTAGLFTRARRLVRWLLLGWAWLTLIGGLLSVVPLPIWPYQPEQSVTHYSFHALYALLQLPLLIALRPTRGVPET